jgi:rhodanese-related sulfurtransferase
MKKLLLGALVTSTLIISLNAADLKGSLITKGVKEVNMTLNDESFTIMRDQAKGAKIHPLYETTFRGKIQPISLHPLLETYGELEVIDFMKRAQHDKNLVFADSRKPGWFANLRIPGSINMPFTQMEEKESSKDVLDELGVTFDKAGNPNFENAKTVLFYCNGMWCGQTPGMVKNAKYSLLNWGYPPAKIKYYRGGMQDWTALGLTVVGDKAK